MAIKTLLRVRCLPVEARNSRRGKRYSHNFVFSHSWLKKVTWWFSYVFHHKIACILLSLYSYFDANRSLAAVSSAMQKQNLPAPCVADDPKEDRYERKLSVCRVSCVSDGPGGPVDRVWDDGTLCGTALSWVFSLYAITLIFCNLFLLSVHFISILLHSSIT